MKYTLLAKIIGHYEIKSDFNRKSLKNVLLLKVLKLQKFDEILKKSVFSSYNLVCLQ